MADFPKALHHAEADAKEDGALQKEAQTHLAGSPPLQVMAELMTKLRRRRLPWWTAENEREWWPATERMRWYVQRADLRQEITRQLTGLAPKTARKKSPDFQASLIDSALDDGDVTMKQFEDAFGTNDMATYAPATEFWVQFRHRLPWDQDTPVHQELFAWLVRTLLATKSGIEGVTRKAILTPWDVRAAIGARVWQSRIPLDVRVAVDDARLKHEKQKPTEPWSVAQEFVIVTAEVISANVPLKELSPILDAAEKAMGISGGTPRPTTGDPPPGKGGVKISEKPAEKPKNGGPPSPNAKSDNEDWSDLNESTPSDQATGRFEVPTRAAK